MGADFLFTQRPQIKTGPVRISSQPFLKAIFTPALNPEPLHSCMLLQGILQHVAMALGHGWAAGAGSLSLY